MIQSNPSPLPLTIAMVLLLSACATASPSAVGPRSNPDLLTAAEIPTGRFNTAFEAVESLRPRWLRSRPNVNLGNELAIIMVYFDNVRQGGVEALQSLTPEGVERMEWIDAPTATQRWGTGNSVGAIAVTTRRGG